jgi:hypothetical protein
LLSWRRQQLHQLPVDEFITTITEAVESANASRLLVTGINIRGLFAKALGTTNQAESLS